MRKNLTVTFGLRYELFSPLLNHQNELSNFTPANGGELVTVPSDASGWFERSLIHPDKNNFAPRLGFSYHPWERVVFRGGYGVFYQQGVRIGSESILALNPPAVISYSLGQGLGSTTPVFQLQNGFPIDQFTSGTFDLTQLQIRAQDPNERTGYVEQASFGPQLQITQNMSLDVSYVGNFARKDEPSARCEPGHLHRQFDGTGNPIDIYPYANLNTTNSSASGNHAFLELATNDGNSNYNALLVSLRHRFTRGISYGVSYTWSHNISDYVDNLTGTAFPQNSYDYAAERGDSMFDVRQRFVSFVTYELPVGKGKRYLGERRSRELHSRRLADQHDRYRSNRRHDSTVRARYQSVGRQSRFAAGLHRRCAFRSVGRSAHRVLAESGGVCHAGNRSVSGIVEWAFTTAPDSPTSTSASSRSSR